MRESHSSEYKASSDSHKLHMARSAGRVPPRAKGEGNQAQPGTTEEEARAYPKMPVESRYQQGSRTYLVDLLLGNSL